MDLWIWTTLHDRSQRRPLLRVQLAEGGGLAVLQALRSFRVEAQNPVPDDLQAHPRKAGRIRTTMTIVDHPKRQKATALRASASQHHETLPVICLPRPDVSIYTRLIDILE